MILLHSGWKWLNTTVRSATKGPSQVRIKPKSYKTPQVRVKFENNLIHPELSLVLPVLACTKRVEVY